jgi:putative drug exporter of the RND superfamily
LKLQNSHYSTVKVLVWLAIFTGISLIGLLIGTNTELPGPSNPSTLNAIPGEVKARTLGLPLRDTVLIVLSNTSLDIDHEKFVAARENLLKAIDTNSNTRNGVSIFESISTYEHNLLGNEFFVSKDRHSILIKATTKSSIDLSAEDLKSLPSIITDFKSKYSDFELRYLGLGTANNEMFDIINSDLDNSLIYTLPLTFLVLFWVFKTVGSALVILGFTGLNLGCSLGLASIISHSFGPISATAAQLVVLLVLAVGIDYALFMLSRIREEIQNGHNFQDAVNISNQQTGRAILSSGLIVAISLAGLFIMGDTILASMASIAIVAVLVSMFSTIVVLPSVFLLFNTKLWWGQVPWLSTKGKTESSGIRWVKLALKFPIATIIVSLLFLGILSAMSMKIKIGSTIEPELFPISSETYQAYQKIRDNFPDLAGVDFSLIFHGKDVVSLKEQDLLEPFFERLRMVDHVTGPLETLESEDGSLVRYQYIAKGSSNDGENMTLIKSLKEDWGPKLLPSEVQLSMAGVLPYVVQEQTLYRKKTPYVFFAVLLISLIFLLFTFNSLVVPIKAVLLNILSTSASFGVLVMVFEYDWFGVMNFNVIESFVPALLFTILFGLSMDYHVFLISRVKEEVFSKGIGDSTFSNIEHTAAVERALQFTFPTITGAASIMICVFFVISQLELPVMKQLGIGLGTAILIDATIVRCLLLPASLVVLGKWNWFMPKSLNCQKV